MALRIENNKGFFEGSALMQEDIKQRRAEQEADRQYAANLTNLQTQDEIEINKFAALHPSVPVETIRAMQDEVRYKYQPLLAHAFNDSLWYVNEEGQREKSNVALPRATNFFNASNALDTFTDIAGNITPEEQDKGLMYNRWLNRYMHVNRYKKPLVRDYMNNLLTGESKYLLGSGLSDYLGNRR